MKKILIIILAFAMLPVSTSHGEIDEGTVFKAALGFSILGAAVYYGHRWYTTDNSPQQPNGNLQSAQQPQDLQQQPSQPEPTKSTDNKQPQEQPQSPVPAAIKETPKKPDADTALLLQQHKDREEVDRKKQEALNAKLHNSSNNTPARVGPKVIPGKTPANNNPAVFSQKQSHDDDYYDFDKIYAANRLDILEG